MGDALREFYYDRKPNFTLSVDERQMVVDYYHDEIPRAEDLSGTDLSAWLR